jgi:hypothetical protein
MTRTEVLAKAKEMGIQTERPLHKTATAVLISLIEKKALEAGIKESMDEKQARGRKINPTSARQQRLAARAMLLENGPIQKGRKPNPTSDRQQRLAAWEAKKAMGEIVRRGRPKMVVA